MRMSYRWIGITHRYGGVLTVLIGALQLEFGATLHTPILRGCSWYSRPVIISKERSHERA